MERRAQGDEGASNESERLPNEVAGSSNEIDYGEESADRATERDAVEHLRDIQAQHLAVQRQLEASLPRSNQHEAELNPSTPPRGPPTATATPEKEPAPTGEAPPPKELPGGGLQAEVEAIKAALDLDPTLSIPNALKEASRLLGLSDSGTIPRLAARIR